VQPKALRYKYFLAFIKNIWKLKKTYLDRLDSLRLHSHHVDTVLAWSGHRYILSICRVHVILSLISHLRSRWRRTKLLLLTLTRWHRNLMLLYLNRWHRKLLLLYLNRLCGNLLLSKRCVSGSSCLSAALLIKRISLINLNLP
jgi:hypothetical protein